jgi:DNA replication protein DnaC
MTKTSTPQSNEMKTPPENCTNCGDALDPQEFIDHQDPLVQRLLNAQLSQRTEWLCPDCSQAKRDATLGAHRQKLARDSWEASIPQEYRETDPKHPDFPRRIAKLAIGWLNGEWYSDPAENRRLCLGLVGASGVCKSRVAAMVSKRIIFEGDRVLWLNSSRFQWACQNQYDDATKHEAKEILSNARSAPWLIFDDIGSLKSTEVISDQLYGLLEHRTSCGLPMIWTSNETLGEMLPRIAEKPRTRILSRLEGFSNQVTVRKMIHTASTIL